jgi:leucyl aminopeptidase
MLEISWDTDPPKAATGQLLAVAVTETLDLDAIEQRFGRGVRESAEAIRFRGKAGQKFDFTSESDGAFLRVVLIGVGPGLDKPEAMAQLGHDTVLHANASGARHLVVDFRWDAAAALPSELTPPQIGSLFARGCQLGTYAYERFLSEERRDPRPLQRVTAWGKSSAANEGTRRGNIIAQAVSHARDLGNGPAELVTPTFLANHAQQIADRLAGSRNIAVTILDREACQARNMGCFLGVAKGSDEPPKFIDLHYTPKSKARGKMCLIGKGVTFDSGGYSLKPSDAMLEMKLDMCGAAAVLSAVEAIAELELPWEVHAIVAATENMVSGHAYRLGDVLTASNGKTVEINNTDAEGRLTLADALVYAAKHNPDFMIDFATLTGACIIALGPYIAGVMSKDEALTNDWMAAAERSGELMWRLPLHDDLKEMLKSKVADLKNTGERWGGALTAGLFLSEFAEGCRWLHVDIAGPSMASKAHKLTTPGGTGFAVATIVELLSGDIERR